MPEDRPRCRLIIAVEARADDCERLAAALGAGDIASVLIAPAAGRNLDEAATRSIVGAAQKAGAAALIVEDVRLAAALGADGVHLSAGASDADCKAARAKLSNRNIVGADAGRSRDAAMRLGEAGADYVGFGIPAFVTDRDAARRRRLELIAWWAEIFEVPCVALDVGSEDDALELARAGADFVAVRLPNSAPFATAREATRAFLAAVAAPVA